MKRVNIFVLVFVMMNSGGAYGQQGLDQPPQAPADPSQIDPSTGAACITRPGKLEPLVLSPIKNSAYYNFLKAKNMSWIQKIRQFFRNVYPRSDQES